MMQKVYVRWYGNIMQGELLDGECMGMKQVRIPLDGHNPIALFTPEHVYDSIEQVTEKSSINLQKVAENIQNSQEIAQKQQIISNSDILPVDDRNMIETFKRENWNHERNHLRIDKLDEFYQLWRMVMKPFGFVEVEVEAPKRIVSDERMEKLKQQLKSALSPKPNPEIQKPSKKMLRSTGQQQFNDSTQLSLFE